MEIRPLDFAEMGTIDYDITKYQPVLYARRRRWTISRTRVGGFFRAADDDTPARLGVRRHPARR